MLFFTWEAQVSHHETLPLLRAAHQGQIGISEEEGGTGEEGDDPNAHSVTAGVVVMVEYADHLWWFFRIYIALCCNGGENHNGKHLEFTRIRKSEVKMRKGSKTSETNQKENVSLQESKFFALRFINPNNTDSNAIIMTKIKY